MLCVNSSYCACDIIYEFIFYLHLFNDFLNELMNRMTTEKHDDGDDVLVHTRTSNVHTPKAKTELYDLAFISLQSNVCRCIWRPATQYTTNACFHLLDE